MNYFITGTDTGVGKTLISCALLHAFAAKGKRVVGMKPVAAGCDDDGLNDDVKKLRASSNILASLGQINPYSFIHPIAPHIASKNSGVRINFERIIESYKELASQAEIVIVEGVGGILVPLNETQDSIDLIYSLDLPVIVIVGMRLGCLNHALLTFRALDASGLNCAGWVANILDEKMLAIGENIETLKEKIKAPLLGVIEYQSAPDDKLIASKINLSMLNNEQITSLVPNNSATSPTSIV